MTNINTVLIFKRNSSIYRIIIVFFVSGLTLSLPDLPDLRRSQFIDSLDVNKKQEILSHTTPLSSQTINKWFVQPDIHSNRLNTSRTSSEGTRTKQIY